MARTLVALLVARRGYGPWYQREAWETVRHWQPNWIRLDEYLTERFPQLPQPVRAYAYGS